MVGRGIHAPALLFPLFTELPRALILFCSCCRSLALRLCIGAAAAAADPRALLGRLPSLASQLGKFEEVRSILALESPFCYGYGGGVVG
jgi:hypothetical protein